MIVKLSFHDEFMGDLIFRLNEVRALTSQQYRSLRGMLREGQIYPVYAFLKRHTVKVEMDEEPCECCGSRGGTAYFMLPLKPKDPPRKGFARVSLYE